MAEPKKEQKETRVYYFALDALHKFFEKSIRESTIDGKYEGNVLVIDKYLKLGEYLRESRLEEEKK